MNLEQVQFGSTLISVLHLRCSRYSQTGQFCLGFLLVSADHFYRQLHRTCPVTYPLLPYISRHHPERGDYFALDSYKCKSETTFPDWKKGNYCQTITIIQIIIFKQIGSYFVHMLTILFSSLQNENITYTVTSTHMF